MDQVEIDSMLQGAKEYDADTKTIIRIAYLIWKEGKETR